MFSPEQDQDVADWYKEREWLYNLGEKQEGPRIEDPETESIRQGSKDFD